MCSTMEYNSQEATTDLFRKNCVTFLQTNEAEDPVVPQPQLCAPLTPQGPGNTWGAPGGQKSPPDKPLQELQLLAPLTLQAQANPNEPIQNQARTLIPLPEGPQFYTSLASQGPAGPLKPSEDKDLALDQLFEELMEMPSWHQNMNCSSQSNLTAASQMTYGNDMVETFSGDQTLPGRPSMMYGGDWVPNGSQTPFTLAQIQQEKQIAFTGSQITNGSQIPCGQDQSLNGNRRAYTDSKILKSQVPFTGTQMGNWNYSPFNRDQKQSENQMIFSGHQTLNTSQMPFSVDQSLTGNQMSFTATQTLYDSQVPFGGEQTVNGNQTLFNRDQTHYDGQMTSATDLQTMTFDGDEIVTGSQSLIQSDNQSLYGIQMVQQELSLPQSGYLYSSALLVQGPSTESKEPNKLQRRRYKRNTDVQKCYACTFQDCEKVYYKSSHLRIHERIHTGDKPYVCDVKGCPWKFPRSDELRRHKKTHTGERPYRCPECHKDFARSDHLKQHEKIHSFNVCS